MMERNGARPETPTFGCSKWEWIDSALLWILCRAGSVFTFERAMRTCCEHFVLLLLLAARENQSVASGRGEGEALLLTEFERPEDLRDLQGTPFILVSESSLHRDVAGRLSLLDTRDYSRHVLEPTEQAPAALSIFADPACIPTRTLAPHGIDILQNKDSSWQVAVVNHYEYESIEFFVLDIAGGNSTATLAPAGCTRNLGGGDIHNSVSYIQTRTGSLQKESLAVTLWFDTFYGWFGQLLFYWSFLDPFPNAGSGALKMVGPGGTPARIVAEPLNGSNGLLYADCRRVLVALTSAGSIVEIDPTTGTSKRVLRTNMPDNLLRGPNEEAKSSSSAVLLTRIDSSLIPTALCYLTSWPLLCRNMKFSVVEYDDNNNNARVLYSGSNQGFTTVGMIKDDVLYVGTLQFNRLLVLPGITSASFNS